MCTPKHKTYCFCILPLSHPFLGFFLSPRGSAIFITSSELHPSCFMSLCHLEPSPAFPRVSIEPLGPVCVWGGVWVCACVCVGGGHLGGPVNLSRVESRPVYLCLRYTCELSCTPWGQGGCQSNIVCVFLVSCRDGGTQKE